MLDLQAAVHHHLQTGGFTVARHLLIDQARLQPQGLRADPDRVVEDRGQMLVAAEDVDEIGYHR